LHKIAFFFLKWLLAQNCLFEIGNPQNSVTLLWFALQNFVCVII